MELKLLLSQLTEVEKDDLYRLLWIEYVKEDIRSYLENDEYQDLTDSEKRDIVNDASRRYVYDGKYDCNSTYWTNIENLIETILEEERL